MKWTPAQESALSSRRQNLLLSAAAGSGKTAVLVERVIRRITDETDPVDVNRFLILTFTRAAASEMKSRISAALSSRLREEGAALAAGTAADDSRFRYLSRQLSLLGSASVTTIDAFCQSLLRRYFYRLDIDPDFRILADESEAEILRQDVLEGVLLTWYEKNDPAFNDLVDLFSSEYQDEALRRTLIEVYKFSLALPFPEDFIRRIPEAYDTKGAKTPDELPWIGCLLTHFRGKAAACMERYGEILARIVGDPAFAPYESRLLAEMSAFRRLQSAKTWAEWRDILFGFTFDKLPQAKPKLAADPEDFAATKELIKYVRDKIAKPAVKELSEKYFSKEPEELVSDLAESAPIARTFSEVLLDFHAAYMERKKQEGLMEFSDTEYYALRLLMAPESREGRVIPSETALELREKYKEVMVDEYQDTNELQDLITALVSTGDDRFLVGDIKQSIYRFRLADPEIFMKKYRSYTGEAAHSRRIDLNQNFRSSPEILTATNFIFTQIMQEEDGRRPLELTYGDAEALHPGRGKNAGPAALSGDVELDLLDLSDKDTVEAETEEEWEKPELEARMIASRIASLMAQGSTVTAKDGTPRPLTYDDIVILLRSDAGAASAMVRTLRECGIPASSNRPGDFFSAIEVQILWAILKLLDNPRQDIALAAVLRFPPIGLSEDSLACLRLKAPGTLWDALREASDLLPEGEALRVIRFLKHYRAWREIGEQDGTSPLIEAILKDLSLLSYFSGMEGGALRRAHLLSFYEAARSWDTSNRGGLYHFLLYLSQTEANGKPFSEAASVPASEGAVRIMTIHKSKGLEFPVVFLAGTSKRFNMMDAGGIAIVTKKLGLALQHFQKDPLCRWPTLFHSTAALLSKEETRAEEARLLYVAMTRARDKLIITASVKNAKKDLARWAAGLTGRETGIDALPAHRILTAECYLDWIMPAALRSRSLAPLWDYIETIPAYVTPAPEDTPHFLCRIHPTAEFAAKDTEEAEASSEQPAKDPVSRFLAAPAAGNTEWLDDRFSWRYTHPGAAETPAKLTATAAVKLAEAEKEEEMPSEVLAETIREDAPLPYDFAEPPAFLAAEENAYAGTSYGTLMHKAMEKLDFRTLPASEDAIRGAIRSLADDNVFTEDEAKTLLGRRGPALDILAFLKSPLGALMQSADVIRKEMPFSILLPAREFYPSCEDGEEIFLQGAIDCLLEKDGRLTIIDYKTDRVENGAILREHYHRQLTIYAESAEKILGKPVERLCLWAFHLRETIDIPREKKL